MASSDFFPEVEISRLKRDLKATGDKVKELESSQNRMQVDIGKCVLAQLNELVLWKAQMNSQMHSFRTELLALRSQKSNGEAHGSLTNGFTKKAGNDIEFTNADSFSTEFDTGKSISTNRALGDSAMAPESETEKIKFDLQSLSSEVLELRKELRSTNEELVAEEEKLEEVEEEVEEIKNMEFNARHFYDSAPVALEQSVWDGAIFIGVEGYSTVIGGLFSFVLVLLNTVMQAIFVAVVTNFLNVTIVNADVVEGLLAWRLEVGHHLDSMSSVSGHHSLVARVCNRDKSLGDAYFQSRMLDVLNGYLSDLSGEKVGPVRADGLLQGQLVGPVLAMMCMLVWVFNISTEFQRVFDLGKAFLNVPRGTSRLTYRAGSWHLSHVTGSRLFWIAFLMLVRFVIASILVIAGLGFLANTVSLEGLLLNAIALDFILNVDTIVYNAMAPIHMKNLIEQLEPLPVPSRPICCGVDVQAPLVLFCSCASCFVGLFTIVMINVDTLYDAHDALCAGYLDFVQTDLVTHPFTGWTPTSSAGPYHCPSGKFWEEQLKKESTMLLSNVITTSIIAQDFQHEYVVRTQYKGLDWSGESLSAAKSVDFSASSIKHNPDCTDILARMDRSSSRGIAELLYVGDIKELESVYSDLDEGNSLSCSNFVQLCHDDNLPGAVSRFYCAKTCGCQSPSSDQVIRSSGCPNTCYSSSAFQKALRPTCEDSTLSDLQLDSKWQAFLLKYAKYVKTLTTARFSTVYKWITGNLTYRGCQAVSEMVADASTVNLCDNVYEGGTIGLNNWCPQACKCRGQGPAYVHGCSLDCERGNRIEPDVLLPESDDDE